MSNYKVWMDLEMSGLNPAYDKILEIATVVTDNNLEIIFVGYSSSGDVFAINHDGSNVNNFPVQINSKILNGVGIYDINDNGKDDIVVATENDKEIHIIYDDGS